MFCKDCGEKMEGDGYSVPVHCPNADYLDWYDKEPDAVPTLCGGWISVEDALPSTDQPSKEYNVYETLNNKVQHDYFIVPEDGSKPFWNHYGKYVTHWRPLPKSPNNEEV